MPENGLETPESQQPIADDLQLLVNDENESGIPAIPLPEAIVLPQMLIPLHLETCSFVRAVAEAMVVENLVELNPEVPPDVLRFVRGISEPGVLADHAAYSPEYTYEQRQKTLETLDPIERLRLALEYTRHHLEIAQLRSKIREDVKS